MEILPFEPDMTADLARCYNELVAPVPYHRRVGEEWFTDLRHSQSQRCTEEAILVAREEGEVVGFAHVGVAAPATEKWHVKGEPGVIRFLSYRPGERPIGAALLQASERWARERERTQVVALDGAFMYRFYPLRSGHISERVSHLPPLFGVAGYAIPESEVFFHWPDFQPPEVSRPDLKFDLTCEERATGAPEVTVQAKQGERQVGECKMVSLRGDRWRPQFADWCVCDNLSVDEPLQRKGLGKYLLAKGLAEMWRAGCRHAMISTDWNNYRAYLFYTNFGYSFLDRTLSFQKALEPAEEASPL